MSISPSHYPIAADNSHPRYSHASSLPSPRDDRMTHVSHPSPFKEEHPSYSGLEETYDHPVYNWSVKPHHIPSIHPPTAIPSLASNFRPRRLEEIAPRNIISLIIALFFDYVYPLTPCIHKPSFMADLQSRREERDPLFFALVASTMASTLVQVPRSYLPMERPVVRRLAQACHEASRHISVASYDPPTSMHVVIRYL